MRSDLLASGLDSCVRKNVQAHPVDVPQLELVHIQRQVLAASLVERSQDAARKDAPESLNGVRADSANNRFRHPHLSEVIGFKVPVLGSSSGVGEMLARREQTSSPPHNLVSEPIGDVEFPAGYNPRNDVSLALDMYFSLSTLGSHKRMPCEG
jgi:hypothetical protein